MRMESFERLKTLVAQAEDDVKKAAGGNKAAGTRVRQAMQEIKAAAQDVREKILEMRDAGGASGGGAAGGGGGNGASQG
jgi:hypothetical protein